MFQSLTITGLLLLFACLIFKLAKTKSISNFINRFLQMQSFEKQNPPENIKSDMTLPDNLDIYNEIIKLQDKISFTNLWLFLICLMFFVRFILPIILVVIGLANISNELQNIFQ